MSGEQEQPAAEVAESETVEGRVMTEQELDRMRITSWWASYSWREKQS